MFTCHYYEPNIEALGRIRVKSQKFANSSCYSVKLCAKVYYCTVEMCSRLENKMLGTFN
jgi:hypothetical protein